MMARASPTRSSTRYSNRSSAWKRRATRDTGGIGLGLATVRSIVLDHGGEVSVSNRKEGGLRATVFLPAAEATGI